MKFIGYYWGAKVYRTSYGWLMTPPEPRPIPKITYCRNAAELEASKSH